MEVEEKLDSKIEQMESNLRNVQADIAEINDKIVDELYKDIKTIAECHIDLSRTLNQNIVTNSEVRLLCIKMNMLETKLNNLEKRLSM